MKLIITDLERFHLPDEKDIRIIRPGHENPAWPLRIEGTGGAEALAALRDGRGRFDSRPCCCRQKQIQKA